MSQLHTCWAVLTTAYVTDAFELSEEVSLTVWLSAGPKLGVGEQRWLPEINVLLLLFNVEDLLFERLMHFNEGYIWSTFEGCE